jgi:hypothetical protein
LTGITNKSANTRFTGLRLRAGFGFPFGRPKCEAKITLAPWSSAWVNPDEDAFVAQIELIDDLEATCHGYGLLLSENLLLKTMRCQAIPKSEIRSTNSEMVRQAHHPERSRRTNSNDRNPNASYEYQMPKPKSQINRFRLDFELCTLTIDIWHFDFRFHLAFVL